MNIQNLDPYPKHREIFRRDRQKFLPNVGGCYVLTSFQDIVLYVGLSKNLRQRFGNHLDDSKKTSMTKNGKAFFFHWLVCDELENIERTWLNECEISDGRLPILNRIASPVSI